VNYRIRKGVLEDVLLASSNTSPSEFFALLGCRKEPRTIDEFVVVSAEYCRDAVLVREWQIPFDRHIRGSVHSHTEGRCAPSHTDLRNFAKFGEIHLITFPPFASESFAAFDCRGAALRLEVVG
jgi:proteasome lid subunit RPN8/RPN11